MFALSPDAGMVERAVIWLVALAGPTYLGLLLFAGVGAVVGYVSVNLGWRLWVSQKWKRRQRQRAVRAAPVAAGGVGTQP